MLRLRPPVQHPEPHQWRGLREGAVPPGSDHFRGESQEAFCAANGGGGGGGDDCGAVHGGAAQQCARDNGIPIREGGDDRRRSLRALQRRVLLQEGDVNVAATYTSCAAAEAADGELPQQCHEYFPSYTGCARLSTEHVIQTHNNDEIRLFMEECGKHIADYFACDGAGASANWEEKCGDRGVDTICKEYEEDCTALCHAKNVKLDTCQNAKGNADPNNDGGCANTCSVAFMAALMKDLDGGCASEIAELEQAHEAFARNQEGMNNNNNSEDEPNPAALGILLLVLVLVLVVVYRCCCGKKKVEPAPPEGSTSPA